MPLSNVSMRSEKKPKLGPTVPEALAMYALTEYEVLYEPKTDTKAILAWGNNIILLAFKGSSSVENAITNINVIKCVHLPYRWHAASSIWGFRMVKSVVRVHRGFYNAWKRHGYSERVLNRVDSIFEGMRNRSNTTFLLTGHSLGGALATLAAHDIKCRFPEHHVTVYTYGQPRVGNRSFALEYNKLVDEHFSIINDGDPVSSVPKSLYKRAGERVRINDRGDIMISPTFLEMQLINRGGMFHL